MNDLKFALRQLLKNKGFTLVAVLTLALGIGANTAIFSLVNAMLLSRLPYAHSDEIVAIWNGPSTVKQGEILPITFQSWREQSHSFSDLALVRPLGFSLTETPGATNVVGCEVTPNLFPMLEVPALHGRTLMPGDEKAGTSLAVLSYNLWQRNFGGDESLVGRSVRINGEICTVVGIMPRGFVFPPLIGWASKDTVGDSEVWVPFDVNARHTTSARSYLAFGRLRSSVTLEQAQSELNVLESRSTEVDSSIDDRPASHVALLADLMTRKARPVLLILAGAVAFILLIACANVANLLLARAMTRSREIAVRAALGATRGRLFRQILTECALLALLGAGAGWGMAYGGLKLMANIATIHSPWPITMNLPVFGFALLLSVITTVLFGTGAAWQMAGRAIGAALRGSGRGEIVGVPSYRLHGSLVVAQVALSLMLLISAGLFIRTLWSLLHADPGFRAEGVLTMDLRLDGPKYPYRRRAASFAQLIERIRELPEVTAAGATQILPIRSDPIGEAFQIKGRPPRAAGDLLPAEYGVVTPGYFSAMRIPLREGRYLSDADTPSSPKVVVVNERLARLYFNGESAVGHQLMFGSSLDEPAFEIVGVVGNVQNWGLTADLTPEIYVSSRQSPKPAMTLVIRTKDSPLALVPRVRSEVYAFDSQLDPERIGTLEDVVSQSLVGQKINFTVFGLFAGLAVCLATFGLYSLMTYLVARRTREIGIRMALGARHGEVLFLVIRQGMVLAGLGLVAGLCGALAMTRVLRSLLFGIGPTDATTFVTIPVLLGVFALLACWLPARRAARVDPMEALRNE
ncbi:FtsX-like permease family protein [bacterium]|nr:FtsX-like permease family protein [bacterium]